jgi:ATP-dependent protease HslVU (ClpYQ) peptidase subunit
MTCIVGLEHDGRVTIGGDAAAVGEMRIVARVDPKVFRVGPYLIGFTESFRMGQLLRFTLDVPEQTSTADDFEHLCTVFVDAVRQCFRDGGVARDDHGEETGGSFLVGYRGALYCVDDDYHVGRSVLGYESIGCGSEFALGSLASTTGNPRRRILTALAAAALHSVGVCEPFTTLSI